MNIFLILIIFVEIMNQYYLKNVQKTEKGFRYISKKHNFDFPPPNLEGGLRQLARNRRG